MSGAMKQVPDANVTPERIMQVGFGFWASKTLLTAVGMALFTELARQPGSLDDIRQRFKLHPKSARDFLDSLVALGFLQRDEQGVYRNAHETEQFLDKNKSSYIGGILEMCNNRLYRFWDRLPEALRTGQRQNESREGGDFFATLYAEPARLKEFLRAMSGLSRGANLAIAAKIPWKQQYKTFIDVGTAQGDLAVQIALANPHLYGTGFDLPEVGPIFNDYVSQNHLTDRLKFAVGSFFTDPIPPADVVLMGHILHDWDLDQKKMLLKKAYDAVPKGGSVVIYDSLIDDARRTNAFGLLMSLNMLIETEGGFDYTGADCQGWMQEIGFGKTRVEHLVGPDSMVVGVK
jgi:O-methyltransferase domain/Dimerisation domain